MNERSRQNRVPPPPPPPTLPQAKQPPVQARTVTPPPPEPQSVRVEPPVYEQQAQQMRADTRPEETDQDERRVRLRSGAQAVDPLHIPQQIIDAFEKNYGLSIEWKRYTLLGQYDRMNVKSQEEQGFRPVRCNHPLLDGMYGDPGCADPVIVGDVILMERPIALREEARAEERRAANHQLDLGHQQVRDWRPSGDAPVTNDRGIQVGREAMNIPD